MGHKYTVDSEEVIIVLIIVTIWVSFVLLFIKKWGRIRRLEPRSLFLPKAVLSGDGSIPAPDLLLPVTQNTAAGINNNMTSSNSNNSNNGNRVSGSICPIIHNNINKGNSYKQNSNLYSLPPAVLSDSRIDSVPGRHNRLNRRHEGNNKSSGSHEVSVMGDGKRRTYSTSSLWTAVPAVAAAQIERNKRSECSTDTNLIPDDEQIIKSPGRESNQNMETVDWKEVVDRRLMDHSTMEGEERGKSSSRCNACVDRDKPSTCESGEGKEDAGRIRCEEKKEQTNGLHGNTKSTDGSPFRDRMQFTNALLPDAGDQSARDRHDTSSEGGEEGDHLLVCKRVLSYKQQAYRSFHVENDKGSGSDATSNLILLTQTKAGRREDEVEGLKEQRIPVAKDHMEFQCKKKRRKRRSADDLTLLRALLHPDPGSSSFFPYPLHRSMGSGDE